MKLPQHRQISTINQEFLKMLELENYIQHHFAGLGMAGTMLRIEHKPALLSDL